MTPATIPATPEELIAQLPATLRPMAEIYAAMLPPEVVAALVAALPRLVAAVQTNDYPACEAALSDLGFGPFAPIVWEQARDYLAAV